MPFIFPTLQMHCSCISNSWCFFNSKIKANKLSKVRNVLIWVSVSLSSASIPSSTASKSISRSLSLVSASELGQFSQYQLQWNPQNSYFHRPYRLWHCTKNLHSIGYPSRNLQNSLCLSNSTKLWTKDITGNSTLSQKRGYKFHENLVPVSNRRDVSKTRLYRALRGVLG